MKKPKIKYHKWNMLRRYLNNPYKYNWYAYLEACIYFINKEYLGE